MPGIKENNNKDICLNDIYSLLLHVNTRVETGLFEQSKMFESELEKTRQYFSKRMQALETLFESVERLREQFKIKDKSCARHDLTLKKLDQRIEKIEQKLNFI